MADIEKFYRELGIRKMGISPTGLALDILASADALKKQGYTSYTVCLDRGEGEEAITIEVKTTSKKI